MEAAEAMRFTLEVESSEEPIRGRILEEGGEEGREFRGWLGFASALGELLGPISRGAVEKPR